MFDLLKLFWLIITDQRAEGEGAGDGSGDAGDAGNAGDGSGDAGDDGDGGGTGEQKPPEPTYGEYGSDPTQAAGSMFEAIKKINSDFDNFKKKTALTETNLGNLRKTLQSLGIREVRDEDGSIRLETAQQQTRKSRFTDQHKALFEEPVLNAIKNLVLDELDAFNDNQTKILSEKRMQQERYVQEKQASNKQIEALFPQLNKENENFDQSFYDKATEILHTRYGSNRLKELSACIDAAIELGIFKKQQIEAKKEGADAGKKDKKILGPVKGSGSPGSGKGKVSKQEYLSWPQEKRDQYDMEQLNNK